MRLVPLATAVLVALGIYYWFVARHDGAEPPAVASMAVAETKAAETPAVPVATVTSIAQPIVNRLVLRGQSQAARSVQVAAETAGRVVSEPLRAGASVAKGQVLCRIDAGSRMAALAEAQAGLAEAQAEADAAATLSEKGFTAPTTLKARRATLRAAQAKVDEVLLDLSRLEIMAPFDGVLETDTAEFGSRLSPGEHCANVIDLSEVKARAYVAETEVDLLTEGQPARARLINGMEVEGTLTFLSRMSDPTTRTYAVDVTIDNPDGRIRDGMTTELLIDLPAASAHLLPQSALTLDDDGRLGVRVVDGDRAKFVPVKVLRDTRHGAFVSGLAQQAEVIVIGQEFVRDGGRIDPRPVAAEDLP